MVAHALIFDLDGTVWDSAGWFAEGIADGDHTRAVSLRTDLINGANIINALERAGISRQRMLKTAFDRIGPPPLFEGIPEALLAIQARGTSIAVATSLPGSIALPMLEAVGLTEVFEHVVHAGVCRVPKPNPASINKALSLMGHQASSVIYYVGDRAVDAAAAVAASVSSAWVAHGYEAPPAHARIVTSAEISAL